MPDEFLKLLAESQRTLDEGFAHLPPNPATPLDKAASDILQKVATRLHDNYPYAHPLYAGQMLKPPHPIARAAYALAMSVNPNNHALDGGRASSAMEIEAVAALAKMFQLAATSRSPQQRRNLRQPRSALGRRILCAGKSNRRLQSGPLHPQPHQRRPRPSLHLHPHPTSTVAWT